MINSITNNLTGMNIYIMSDDGMVEHIWLSFLSRGRLSLNNKLKNLFYFELVDKCWKIVGSDGVKLITDDGHIHRVTQLVDKKIIYAKKMGKVYGIYAENTNDSSNIFHNYFFEENQCITIGRDDSNDIIYSNKLVSNNHASIMMSNGRIVVTDTNSSNGIYVNGKKMMQAYVELGDVIYIMGLQLIIGIGFVSINDGNNRIRINSKFVKRIKKNEISSKFVKVNENYDDFEYYSRSPRYIKSIIPSEINIEAPPIPINSNQIPLILRLGGSAVMGGSAALSGHLASLICSLLFPLMTNKYTEKEKKDYEERRVSKYNEYLNKKIDEIQKEKYNQELILNESFPNVQHIIDYIKERKKLWQRRTIDNDFLQIRVGNGNGEFLSKIIYPEEEFDMDEDFLKERMVQIARKKIKLENIPIISSLIDFPVSGIIGNQRNTQIFFLNILMQIIILHSYDEVKTVFFLDEEDINKYNFIKYIPHSWNDQRTERFIATNYKEAYHIGEYLRNELENVLEHHVSLADIMKHRPYYVIFANNKRLFDSVEVLKEVMQYDGNCGISIITMFEDLPKDCSLIYDVGNLSNAEMIYLHDINRESEQFVVDSISEDNLEYRMFELSNIFLKKVKQDYALPNYYEFLELFDVGKVEHLNIIERWKNSDSVKSLATPIGLTTDGNLFSLDLHEKYQGPHGLVAGMTGSGKSEFLMTYILSMAINYPPEDVGFLLIDYKGGGLADAFENKNRNIRLPHLLGTITNLDGSEIQRSLISLQGEIRRRQRVFRHLKSITDEGTMDIYMYQKLFHQKKVTEAIPHLFIVADEFAELKKEEPEFMDQLISIARIGRSLGIHLILATQKPAGVVNDQIRSNSKFRVCLKVQDRSDSQDVIGKAFGAEIKEPGRFYLQVGQNDLFSLGQSAWCGADYRPSDEVTANTDDSVQFVDMVGQVIHNKKKNRAKVDGGVTQLVAIVREISEIRYKYGVKENCLWKPKLEKTIDSSNYSEQYGNEKNSIRLPLGVVDDPENQVQFPYVYDFINGKNLIICGEPKSGKTTMINLIIHGLTSKYTPNQINFYVLDYSSRMLGIYSELPHCCSIFKEEDEDKLVDFIQKINSIVARRKEIFSEIEADSYTDALNKIELPLILIVIDNIAGLMSSKKGQNFLYEIPTLIKTGANYGIKYIITSNYINEILSRTRQECIDRIALHNKDKYSYGDVLEVRCQYEPPIIPGRGLVVVNDRPLEIQVLMDYASSEKELRLHKIKKDIKELIDKYKGYSPLCAEQEPKKCESYDDFCKQFDNKRLPLGYIVDKKTPIALPFKQFSNLSVYFGENNHISLILNNFIFAAKENDADVIIVKRQEQSIFETIQNCNCLLLNPVDELIVFRDKIIKLLQERKICDLKYKDRDDEELNLSYSDFMLKHTKPVFVLFEDMDDFVKNMDEVTEKTFETIWAMKPNTTLAYNIHFIGCFYAGRFENLVGKKVFREFILSELMMFFGGKYDMQKLYTVPREISYAKERIPFNRFLMNYKGTFEFLDMPCGDLSVEEMDPDELPIF